MKTKIPIRVTNRTDITSEKQILFMMRNLFLLLAFALSAMETSAQTARATKADATQNQSTIQGIVHVDQFLASLTGKGTQGDHVRSLLNDVQPSTYVENNGVKSYGDTPICVFT